MKIGKKSLLNKILRSSRTVFSVKELLLLSDDIEPANLKATLNYYVRSGNLYHVRRGLYAKDENYSPFEAATKIMTPSYISFETVLRQAGLIFQYYETIFVASTHSRTITCDGHVYEFRRIKETILTSRLGIEIRDAYSIATPERAFLDLLYLNNDYYLDNPSPLSWERVYEILPLYDNKRMKRVVDNHYKEYKRNLLEES